MALENQLRAISAISVTADSTSYGVVTVSNSLVFKVRQLVILRATGQASLLLMVKDVTSSTTLVVGPRDSGLVTTTDLSLYTLANSATIEAPQQDHIANTAVGSSVIEAASLEAAPTNARRVAIVDSLGDNIQRVVKRNGLPAGTISYMEPYRKGVGVARFFVNQTYGADMNQNAAFGGTPLGIHNGTDSVEWTGTNLVGTNFVFNSTAQAHTGTHSVSGAATADGNEALFTKSSSFSTSGYVAITGWVYLTRWQIDDNITIRLRLAGANVGNSISLSNYINIAQFNSWQQFAIPLGDLGAGSNTVDQMVVHTVNSTGTTPRYYLDDMQFEQTSGTQTYTVVAPANTRYHVTGIGITLVDAIDSTLANASVPALVYNKMLGLSQLTVGIVSSSSIGGNVVFTGVFRNHIDFATYPNTVIQSGGTATSFYVKYDVNFDVWGGTPLVLDYRTNDYITFTINDDLSGLNFFRILTNGIDEPIVAGENDQ